MSRIHYESAHRQSSGVGPNAVTALLSGAWRDVTVGRLGLAAALAALLDVLTTYRLLTGPNEEANVALAALAEIHPATAVGVHAGFAITLTCLCWFSFGWLSIVSGWFVVLGFGAAGVHNLIGLVTGTWPFRLLAFETWILAHYVLPSLAFMVGLALAYRHFGRLPPGEVILVGATLFTITALPPVIL